MKRLHPLVLAALLAAGPAGAGEGATWRFQPAASLSGSWEWSRDDFSALFGLPLPGQSVGAAFSIDGERRSGRSQVGFEGLASLRRHRLSRDWGTEAEWSYSLWGSGHASWSSPSGRRLALAEDARAERLPGLGDVERNQVSAAVETRVGGRGSLTLTLADRRKRVEQAPELGFARQSAALGTAISVSERRTVGLEAAVQAYQADTARGERFLGSAELSSLTRHGVTALRLAIYEPLRDRAGARVAGPVSVAGPANSTNQSVVLESDAEPRAGAGPTDATADLAATEFAADSLLLDRFLESDADEWDFGRRKLLAVGFHSRRLGERGSLSGLVRLQHRRGPDLLDPSSGDAVFEDTRLYVRLVVRRRLASRATLFAEAAVLDSRSERPDFDFTRGLLAAGLGWRF